MLPLFHSWSIKEQERFQLSQFYLKLTHFPLWWSLCTYRMSREHAVVHSVWEPSTNIVCVLVEPPFISPIPVEAANGSQKRAFPFLFKMKQNYIHFFICMFMYPGASWSQFFPTFCAMGNPHHSSYFSLTNLCQIKKSQLVIQVSQKPLNKSKIKFVFSSNEPLFCNCLVFKWTMSNYIIRHTHSL